MTDQQHGDGPNPPTNKPQSHWIAWTIQKVKRYLHDRSAAKKQEDPQDRASRRTANATVFIAILTVAVVLVGGLQYLIFKAQLKVMADQLVEMKGTGKQTDDLIGANKSLVEVANGQLETMRDQLEQLKNAGKQTNLLIEANKKSADAALKSADAATQTATSTIALERPYFFVLVKIDGAISKDGPFDSVATPSLRYTITNMGRAPGVLRSIYVRCYLQREKLPDRPVIDPNQLRMAQSAVAAGLTSPDYPCQFEQPFSKQDWLDVAANRAIPIYTAVLVYEGSLDFTYIDTVSYRIDPFNGGLIYPLGIENYTNEQASSGRISKGATPTLPNIIWKTQPPQKTN